MKTTLMNDSWGYGSLRLLLVVVVVMLCACLCRAQNNPYRINDELYKMYLDAYSYNTKPECIAKAHAMYERAVQLGDKKAQCIALVVPIAHYALIKDEHKFEHALKLLQEKSLAYNYEQYYYYGVTNKVNMLINLQRVPEAFEYLTKIESEADKRGSMYGRFTLLNALGQLHLINTTPSLALDCYERALKVGEEYLKEQDMAPQYRRIAECYESLYDYDRMLVFAMKGFAIAKSPTTKLIAIRGVCYAAFMLGRYDTFLHYYNAYAKLGKHEPNVKSKLIVESELAILKLIYDHKYEEAEAGIDALPEKYTVHKLVLKAQVYRFRGDNAMYANTLSTMYRSRLKDNLYNLNYAGLNSRIANQLLEVENQRLVIDHQRLLNEHQRVELNNSKLELANMQLTLNNSDLELQRTRSVAKLMSYKYSNKQLEAQKLRSSIEAQHARHQANDIILVMILTICLIIFIAFTLYNNFHKRMMKRLNLANAELEENHQLLMEAKERAEADNRAKTAFINNMDEDIRQPLNAVVRSAIAIANSHPATSMAERDANLRNHQEVQRNTNELLAILSDALKKAQL